MSQDQEQRRWWSLLRWPVALGVLAWLVSSNLAGVREVMVAGVNWSWIVAATGLRLAAIFLGAARWKMLLGGQGIHRVYSRVLRLFATGYVCNFVLPGTVGGDVARAGMIAVDSPQQRMRAAASVPLDRLLGLLAFIVIGAIAGIVQWSSIPPGLLRSSVLLLIAFAGVGVCGLVTLLVFRFPPGIGNPGRSHTASSAEDNPSDDGNEAASAQPPLSRRQRAGHELLYGLALLRESRRSVLAAFVFALVGHACLSMTMYSCLRAFPGAAIPAGPVAHLWIVPSAEVPASLIPLPGGVGAREGTLALLYGALADSPPRVDQYREVGVVVAATFSTINVCLAMGLAGWLTLTGGWKNTRPRS